MSAASQIPASSPAEPKIVLGILVVGKPGVVAFEFPKPIKIEGGVVTVVDISRSPPIAMGGPPRTERRIHDPRRGALQRSLADRVHDRRDGVRAALPQGSRHVPDITGRICGMGIAADQYVVTGLGAVQDRGIDPGGLKTSGIIH